MVIMLASNEKGKQVITHQQLYVLLQASLLVMSCWIGNKMSTAADTFGIYIQENKNGSERSVFIVCVLSGLGKHEP